MALNLGAISPCFIKTSADNEEPTDPALTSTGPDGVRARLRSHFVAIDPGCAMLQKPHLAIVVLSVPSQPHTQVHIGVHGYHHYVDLLDRDLTSLSS